MTTRALPVIIPVKTLHSAKQRLAPVLSAEDRRRLVLAMLADVLTTLSKVAAVSSVIVVTPDPDVAAFARAEKAQVLAEPHGGGLNAAVQRGLTHIDAVRAGRVLVIPGDVPLASSEELTKLAESAVRHEGPRVSLVPSHDGGGTNALFLSPPDVIEPEFGPGSFVKHLAAAVARRIDAEVMQLPGLAADVDLPEDLAWLRRARSGVPRYAFLLPSAMPGETILRNMP